MADNNPNGMTEILRRQVEEDNLTIEQAKAKLFDNAYIRTVAETLSRYCNIDLSDEDRLRDRVTDLLHETKPDIAIENIAHTVNTWFNHNQQFIRKESALQLAFAMHLNVKDAEEMLIRLSGEGFHWRNPKDIIWLFALDKHFSYTDACVLLNKMMEVYENHKSKKDDQNTMTEEIKKVVIKISNKEDLKNFLREYAPHLGTKHNTAYQLFKEYLALLQTPPEPIDPNMPKDREMTEEEILTTYLYKKLVNMNNHDVYNDAIRRSIKNNWPDKYSLSRMINRKTDVTRKVLILLFLACDGGESKFGYYKYGDKAKRVPENIFKDSHRRLQNMLNACSFPPLDPRTPFDWIVIYSMVVDDIVDIDRKMLTFLTELFPDTPADAANNEELMND